MTPGRSARQPGLGLGGTCLCRPSWHRGRARLARALPMWVGAPQERARDLPVGAQERRGSLAVRPAQALLPG